VRPRLVSGLVSVLVPALELAGRPVTESAWWWPGARAKSSDSRLTRADVRCREAAIRCRIWAVASTDRPPGRFDLGSRRVLTMQVKGTAVARDAQLRPIVAITVGQAEQS
jgi:hypothetical protein